MARFREIKPDVVRATEFAGRLGARYGRGVDFPAVEAWYVGSDERPRKVMVVQVRGAAPDYIRRGTDYAHTVDREVISGHYLFPAKGYKKPQKLELEDDFGVFHDWAVVKRGVKPEALLENPQIPFPPVIYNPVLPHEGAWFDGTVKYEGRLYKSESGFMMMGSKLFEQRPGGWLHTYLHEFGHMLATHMLRTGTIWTLVDQGWLGKQQPLTGFLSEGIGGSMTPDESVANGYAYLLMEPDFLFERWPEAAAFIAEWAEEFGMPMELTDEDRTVILAAIETARGQPHAPVVVGE